MKSLCWIDLENNPGITNLEPLSGINLEWLDLKDSRGVSSLNGLTVRKPNTEGTSLEPPKYSGEITSHCDVLRATRAKRETSAQPR